MLHLERLKRDIATLGEHAVARQRQRDAAVKTALRWLANAPPPSVLRERVAQAADAERAVALPTGDAPLDRRFTHTAPPARGTTLVAVDGSQIPPDRHAAVLYYLIQVGGLTFRYNGQAPTPHSEATLHFEERELYGEDGLLITGQLGMQRSVAEATYLAALVEEARDAQAPSPILALNDGPLLWPYSGRSNEEKTAFPAYLAALGHIQKCGGIPVGFVERPGGSPLVELLRLGQATPPDEVSSQILTDRALLAQALAPGERSVWLTRSSATNERHARAGQAVWFCYLNVGEHGFPVIARIEVPDWAARQDAWMETLHAVLLHQARILHGNPYVLARAHELAVVTRQDKAALESILHRRLLEKGLVVRVSEKARQKAYLGKRK
ncbi:MAG: DNA double-strand break repair nuclease NurA [Anaerolineae bacterium]|nr:DNA double-strand break repair nuclease NurA [Anaerolineae bacterium]